MRDTGAVCGEGQTGCRRTLPTKEQHPGWAWAGAYMGQLGSQGVVATLQELLPEAPRLEKVNTQEATRDAICWLAALSVDPG